MRRHALIAIVGLALGGCGTTFYGSPVIKGGREQCEKVCAVWKMELVGMVQMGEYSSGCLCQVPGKVVTPQAAAAADAAVAGVWTQMQEEARRRSQPPAPPPGRR